MVIPVTKPKVSQSEKKYREDTFPDVKEIKNKNLLCTSCGGSVNDLIRKGKAIIHPFLETLLCEKCHSFYGDGQFSVDEDGSDKYCRWCGQGGTLFLCSQCTSGFCKKCVKRNLPKSAQSKIEEDDWVCYCCDTSPLYELRAQGWAAQQYTAEYVKNKGSSKSKKGAKESSKRSRHAAENSDLEEEVHIKKKQKQDSKKKSDKRQRNGEEKDGTREGGGGRTLRKRMSKADSESGSENRPEMSSTKTLPGGVRSESLRAAVHRLTSFVSDIAGMTKETHKKLIECKNKKLNVKNISTVASLYDVRKRLNSMMLALETHVHNVRIGIEDFMQEWSKTALSDLKVKGLEGEMMMEYLEMLENGSLPKEGMDSINQDQEAMDICNEKENESDQETKKCSKKTVEDGIKKNEDSTVTNDDRISNCINSVDKESIEDEKTEVGNKLTDEKKPQKNEKSSTDTKSEESFDKQSEDSTKSEEEKKTVERKNSIDDKKVVERVPPAKEVVDEKSKDESKCKSSEDTKASSSLEIESLTNESDLRVEN